MTKKERSRWMLARPEVSTNDILACAHEAYGVRGEAHELGSQQDRNFMVRPAEGPGVLIKVNHPAVPESVLSLQWSVSDRLRARGVLSPRVLTTSQGKRSTTITNEAGEVLRVCAFELVDGATIADSSDIDGALAEELGLLTAETLLALEGYDNPDAERAIQWELSQARTVVGQLIDDLPDERRERCLEATVRADETIAALRGELPVQIIHGDLTSDNIMRASDGTKWVIDLGDTVQSWRAAELAVLLADLIGRTGDMAIVARAVSGFSRKISLTDAETAALWPLVVLRGAVLAVSGWSQLRIDPQNDYARERIEHEWEVFERALAFGTETVTAQLRLAAGKPHRAGLAYAEAIAGMRQAAVIDLGLRSEALDRGRWAAPGVEAELAREALATAPVAIMRFGESRLSRVSTDVMSPAATKARCVDVWARPGVAVRAPFAGAVTAAEGVVTLRDCGVTLRFEGIEVGVASGQKVASGEVIGRLRTTPTGASSVSIMRSMFDEQPGEAFGASGEEYETQASADPSVLLGVSPVEDPVVRLRAERLRRDRSMGGAAERYYENPPQMERGWNTLLIDTEGRSYLDMVNNVTAIGHSHPRLGDAVGRQLHLLNTNSRFLYEAYAEFAEKLLEHSPDPSLDTVIPVNSGSEAIDLALRLAQVATGRRDVITAREGYHGWTMASDAVSTSAFDNPDALASRPEWVHLVDAPNNYRGPHRGADAGTQYARQVADVAKALSDEGRPPAAFICEPVLGNAGGVMPPEGYLAEAYESIRAQGGLAIADEVQVGYGRLGKAFWGSTMQGAVPDILAVAKAAGNAFPLGIVITRREIVDALRSEGMFFSSAGGAPASAIAGSAVLDVIRDERLQENAERVGAYLTEHIEALADRFPVIGTVHGSGLYQGIELVRDRETLEPATEETAWVCERLLDHGVIMQATSERQNVLKVKPPLTLTEADVATFVRALALTLEELEVRGAEA